MTKPIVSVCIPAFNQCDYLRLAIASALNQTVSELEVIVVDDGSSDGTRAVCESFHDARVRYVYQDNDGTRGLGARNHAMLLAQGEWIALLDQDDLWRPDKLQKQLSLAEGHPEIGLIFSRVAFIDDGGKHTGQQTDHLPSGDVLPRLLESNCYFACTGMFRTRLLSIAGLPGEPHGIADWLLWASLARQTRCAVSEELLADYRIHASGYQVSLRAASRYKNCVDHLKTFYAMGPLVRANCSASRAGYARQRRILAHELMRTARHYLKNGEFKSEVTQAIKDAIAVHPGWLARPWVFIQQALALMTALLQGTPKAMANAFPK